MEGPRDPAILVVADDSATAHVWGLILGQLRCRPIVVPAVTDALRMLESAEPDLIVVDITLRETDGIQLCAKLYEGSAAPILLMSPINNESYMLEAYRAGVAECVIKPVSPALFLAKVGVLLRRSRSVSVESLDRLRLGELTLVPARRELIDAKGKAIRLTSLEFRLLHMLMTHPDRTFSSDEIVRIIWGFDGGGSSALVKNVVYRLRKKIEPKPGQMRYLRTETGGYMFRR